MNNKHVVLAGIIAVVVVALGYFAFTAIKAPSAPASLGTAAAYQAMNNQNLLTELQAIGTDATAVRTAVAGTLYTQLYTIPAIGVNTGATSSLSFTMNATTTPGDFLAVSLSSTTDPYVNVSVRALTASTVQVNFTNTSSTISPAFGVSTTINVWDIPNANAFQPAALTQ